MDLRVLVLTGDPGLADLVRSQAENLGCTCTMRDTYDGVSASISWADAAVIDLAGDGLDDLNRLRVEAPRVRILAIALDDSQEQAARTAGADQVLVEPFAVTDVVTAVRALGPNDSARVIDLRTGIATAAPAVDDAPWFSTR